MTTYKQRLNEKFGLNKDTEHTLRELKDFSKNDDLRKGTSKRLSMEQWSKSRIYAFLFKSIFQNMRYKKQDTDLFEELKEKKII
jgi:hypothetical protein